MREASREFARTAASFAICPQAHFLNEALGDVVARTSRHGFESISIHSPERAPCEIHPTGCANAIPVADLRLLAKTFSGLGSRACASAQIPNSNSVRQ